jgi:hypothetical protein
MRNLSPTAGNLKLYIGIEDGEARRRSCACEILCVALVGLVESGDLERFGLPVLAIICLDYAQ